MQDPISLLASLLQLQAVMPVAYGAALLFIALKTKAIDHKFRHRASGFGTVFDSISGKPIDLARVRLIDVHGLTAASAVTDPQGKYRLTAIPGEYDVDVQRQGFVFPSVFLKDHDLSRTYDKVIPARRIKIKDHGIITKNIPMDPANSAGAKSKVFRRAIVLGDNAQLTLVYLGPWLALVIPLLERTNIPLWVMFIAFEIVMLIRISHFRAGKPNYGTIRDAGDGRPLPRAVVRLFESQFNKLLQTQVTSEKGRYAFLVNRGTYHLTIRLEGYKPVRLNIPAINTDGYPLATDVRLQQSGG